MLRIKLVKSVIANTPRNRAIVKSIGLGKTGSVIYRKDTPELRGALHKIKHLLEVTEVAEAPEANLPPTHIKVRGAGTQAEAKPKAAKAAKAPKAEKAEKAEAKPAAKKRTTKKEEA